MNLPLGRGGEETLGVGGTNTESPPNPTQLGKAANLKQSGPLVQSLPGPYANSSGSGWRRPQTSNCFLPSSTPQTHQACLLCIRVILIITFRPLGLKLPEAVLHVCESFHSSLLQPVSSVTVKWKEHKTGEPTPCSNLSCHDSSLWDTEMFRLPAKQNCWMWTFGWKIKRLRGMQKGSTSHIPDSSESNQMALTP